MCFETVEKAKISQCMTSSCNKTETTAFLMWSYNVIGLYNKLIVTIKPKTTLHRYSLDAQLHTRYFTSNENYITFSNFDRILLNKPEKYVGNNLLCGNLYMKIADHLPNFIIIIMVQIFHVKSSPSREVFQEKNSKISKRVSYGKLGCYFRYARCKFLFNSFAEHFSLISKKYFLHRQVSRKKFKDEKWMTKGLYVSIRHIVGLYEKYLQ